MGPWGRRLLTLAVVVALVAPVVANHDGPFPLSTYPMYSRTRPPEVDIVTAVGVDADGEEVELSIRVLADTDDPLIAESRLRAATRSSTTALVMCEEILARADAEVGRVLFVTERHDVVQRASGEDSRLALEVHAECEADGA